MKRHDETKDWSDDPRLTALALGELDGAERAALERELAGSVAGQAALEELRALAATLEGELAAEIASDAACSTPALGLSPEARERIAARPAGRGRPRHPVLLRVGVAVASVAAAWVVALALWPEATPAPFGYDLGFGAPAEESNQVVRRGRTDSPVSEDFDREGRLSRRAWAIPRKGAQQDGLIELGYTGEVQRLGYASEMQGLGYIGEVQRSDGPLREMGYVGETNTETYDRIVENAFVFTADDPLSTFSIDVDTASYANVRRFLNDGRLPPPDAVRIEEMINYFSYDYEATDGVHPFSITSEVASAPWAPRHRLVRIGLRGDEIPLFEPKEKNLVFLIDVSGSMAGPDKLPLLKRSMRLLVDHLGARDRVGIVVYAGQSGVALPPTPCDRKEEIIAAIERLEPGGSTHGSQGIELAYALCEAGRAGGQAGGVNRVILATDGDFNVGVTSDDALVRLIETKRERGVSLSVLGFGTGNLKDSKMEKLADHGNGNYAYVDSLDEARKVLVREMGGTLETIAKDVKIQVEFDPARVAAFRLIGYENRVLAHEDFADDAKDAGEIGAGHRVTALYEVVPVVPVEPVEPGVPAEGAAGLEGEMLEALRALGYWGSVDPMRLGTVRLRYKEPDGDVSRLIERPLEGGGADALGSSDLRFAAGVAAFGMVLRGSAHVGDYGLEDAYALAHSGAEADPFGYRTELLRLIERAIAIRERGGELRR